MKKLSAKKQIEMKFGDYLPQVPQFNLSGCISSLAACVARRGCNSTIPKNITKEWFVLYFLHDRPELPADDDRMRRLISAVWDIEVEEHPQWGL